MNLLPFKPSSLVLPLLSLAMGSAFAVSNGITPADGLVFNPITGQEITAWKRVGTAGCSASQIHPQWVLAAAHCNGGFNTPFKNSYAPNGVPILRCDPHPKYKLKPEWSEGSIYDVALCHLQAKLDPNGVYPPLVAAPTELVDGTAWDALRPLRAKWGYLMMMGNGGGQLRLAITDFGGAPSFTDPAKLTPAPTTIPMTIDNDSGGAAFWISPSSATPGVVGVLTHANVAADGISFLTDETIAWMSQQAAAFGDTLNVVATTTHFTGPTGNAVQELSAPPKVRSINNSRSSFNIVWSDPSTATAPISSYKVTVGQGLGTLEREQSASAGTGNVSPVTGLPSGQHIVCVRPTGASGSALPAFPYLPGLIFQAQYIVVETPNCKTFDTTLAAPGAMTAITPSATAVGSSLSKAAFSWATPSPTPAAYAVSQTVSYASGPSRTTVSEITSGGYSVTVARGSKVCVTIKPLNDIGVSAASGSACIVTN